jgi:hypothetical protein
MQDKVAESGEEIQSDSIVVTAGQKLRYGVTGSTTDDVLVPVLWTRI